MKTPITDKFFNSLPVEYDWGDAVDNKYEMRVFAERLELDRAELMKVIDWLDRWLGSKPMTECSKRITDALTAARANFPKS